LQLAARFNKLEVLQALLEAGAEPNAKNSKTGRTALHEAVTYGRLEVVKALIAKRADINQPDSDGNAPLHTAVSRTLSWYQTPEELEAKEAEIEKVVKLLIQYPKINLNLKNNRGETALYIATQRFTDEGCIARTLKECCSKTKSPASPRRE